MTASIPNFDEHLSIIHCAKTHIEENRKKGNDTYALERLLQTYTNALNTGLYNNVDPKLYVGQDKDNSSKRAYCQLV